MDEQKSNVRILFTAEANSALDDIVKNFGLEETPEEYVKRTGEGKLGKEVVIDHLAKDFAIGEISEKGLSDSLQKDLEVSQQIAMQISKEVVSKIVPFLEKVPEEKLTDPVFIDEVANKVFGQKKQGAVNIKIGQKKDDDLFPNVKASKNRPSPVATTEKNTIVPEERTRTKPIIPPQKQGKIKKIVPPEEIKEIPQQSRQPRGPDNYREPIE